MDIYPQDLGERRRMLAAVQARQRVRSEPEWLRALPLLILLMGLVLLHWVGPNETLPAVGVLLLAARLVPALSARTRPQTIQNAPLTPAQVTRLLAGCDDPLECEYLRLVLAAAQMPAPTEQIAQSEIREAVRALGVALDNVRTVQPKRSDSAHDVVVQAAGLAVDAERESDPVVAASLRRRAETRRKQAETVALLETLARRNAALRQELSDEMDALQTSLAAFGARGVWSVTEMADTAAGISWIALKANAMAAAQTELDEALHIERLPNPTYNGPGGTAQRLQNYRSVDIE